MAGKNQVTLTFAADADALTQESKRAAEAVEQVGREAREQAKALAEAERQAKEEAKALAELERWAKEAGRSVDEFEREARAAGMSNAEFNDSLRASRQRFDDFRDRADEAEQRAQGFRDSITGVQDTISAFNASNPVEGLLLLGSGAADTASAFSNALIPAVKNSIEWMRAHKIATAAALGALGLLVAGFVWLTGEEEEAAEVAKDFTRDLEVFRKTSGALTGELRRTIAMVETFDGGLANGLDSIKNMTDGAAQLNEQFTELVREGYTVEEIQQMLIRSGHRMTAEMLGSSDAFAGTRQAAADYAEQQRALAGSTSAVEEAHREAKKALEDYQSFLLGLANPVFGFRNAQQAVVEAQNNYNDAVKTFGRNSPEAIDASWDLAEAQLAAMDAASKADMSVEDFAKQLRPMAEAAGISEEAINDMIAKYREMSELDDITKNVAINTRVKLEIDAILRNARASGLTPYQLSGSGYGLTRHAGLAAGPIPGPLGQPVPVMARGGEWIGYPQQFTTAAGAMPHAGGDGGVRIGNFNVTVALDELRQIRDLGEWVGQVVNNVRRGVVAAR